MSLQPESVQVEQPDGLAGDPDTAVRAVALRAKAASIVLANATRSVKDAALEAMAEALLASSAELVEANQRDVETAAANGTSTAMIDRLTLTPARIEGMADGLRQVAGLPDPVGEVVQGRTLANGLEVRQTRVPFGVVGIVYEARPNVTVDAAGLCLKSGNVALLRGSGSAYHSNTALVAVLRAAAESVGLPADVVNLVPGVEHDSVKAMLRLRGIVDLIIPRGGAGLIRTVVEESTVPVIETGVGNCHIYVDADADLEMALRIVLNAKTSRPSVCNAAETVLVHRVVAPDFMSMLLPALSAARVTVHGDPAVRAFDSSVIPAKDVDWAEEYLSLDIAVAIVSTLDEALEHIRKWGSAHTEAIITRSLEASRAFIAGCDSAAVMVNASTRFTDGEQFGMGAEVGYQHPEAACSRSDGAARADLDQVDRDRRRAHPRVGKLMTANDLDTDRTGDGRSSRPPAEIPPLPRSVDADTAGGTIAGLLDSDSTPRRGRGSRLVHLRGATRRAPHRPALGGPGVRRGCACARAVGHLSRLRTAGALDRPALQPRVGRLRPAAGVHDGAYRAVRLERPSAGATAGGRYVHAAAGRCLVRHHHLRRRLGADAGAALRVPARIADRGDRVLDRPQCRQGRRAR